MSGPESRTLVLLRHGRTAWNHQGRVQGQTDVDLDEVGVAQAARTGPVVAGLAPSLLWCSDLRRTRATAAPVLEATGLVATYDRRLRELHFGDFEELTHAEMGARDPQALEALRDSRYDDVPGAERSADAVARMRAALDEVLAATPRGETGLVVSHGAVIRLAVASLLGWPSGAHGTLRHLDNCAWAVLSEHPATGVLQLVRWNLTADWAAPRADHASGPPGFARVGGVG